MLPQSVTQIVEAKLKKNEPLYVDFPFSKHHVRERMAAKLFPKIENKPLIPLIPSCGRCGLFKGCKSPKMEVSGNGKKGIYVVAEAPGENEDKQGIQLVGNSGSYLSDTFELLGVDMREDCWLDNSIICRPPENAKPTTNQLSYCFPHIVTNIRQLKPKIIVLLGEAAIKSVLGWLWRDSPGKAVTRWVGWEIPALEINAWIVPNFHPSFCLHAKNSEVHDMYFAKYLKRAVNLIGKPSPIAVGYRTYDYYTSRVLCPQGFGFAENHGRSKDTVSDLIGPGWLTKIKLAAVDFETDRLKPDADDSTIVSVSIATGGHAYSYMLTKWTWEFTKGFLQSPIPKIAQNMKFEDCWTRKTLASR